MNTTTQITDAAVKAAEKEKQSDDSTGFYVQQLLDAEREKWEKKYNQAIEDICCQNAESVEKDKQERDQLRQQLTEAQEQLDYSGVHTCSSQCQRPMCKMRRELLEHKAAIAMKDEALNRVWIEDECGWITIDRGTEIECVKCGRSANLKSQIVHSDECTQGFIHQALSPNCGQPLMELVRAQNESLCDLLMAWENKHMAEESKVKMLNAANLALTKAAQLGF